MSVQAMTWVFKHSPAEGKDRLVLLALANHAGPEMESWPSVETIAHETRIRRVRTVQECLARLVAAGEIVRMVNAAPDSRIRGDHRPNLYRIVTSNGVSTGGMPSDDDGVPTGGTPEDGHGVTVLDARGDGFEHDGVPPVGTQTVSEPSGEPSSEPSGEPSRARARPAVTDEMIRAITVFWTDATGMTVTAMQWDQFEDWVKAYGEDWVRAAITAAALANARSLSYVRSVLETWQRRGRPTDTTEGRRDGRNNGYASGRAAEPGEFAAFR